ncbi:hypothetical protein HDV00_002180 [Rhizophlyctis rosea]|nr:hypothetical protein HDV00_002180 [Rhizophlyctis rosea]
MLLNMLLKTYVLLAVGLIATAEAASHKHYRCFRNGREIDCPHTTKKHTTAKHTTKPHSTITTKPANTDIFVALAKDGQRCGVRANNLSCATGLCCSTVGYCGSTADHCSAGKCQARFGTCGTMSTTTKRTSTYTRGFTSRTSTTKSSTTARTTTTTKAATSTRTSTTTKTTTTTKASTTTTAPSSGSWWKPSAYPITWQVNYPGTWNLNMNNVQTAITKYGLSVINIDLFDVSASQVSQLHGMGLKVICYFSAGSYEDWRSDASSYPKAVIGPEYDGWAGENWLNLAGWENGTPSSNAIATIIKTRLDMAKTKGCDAVDPDNVDSYESNKSNTKTQQLNFNKFIANEAHSRGLAVGLKNDSPQISELMQYFDFAVTESAVKDKMAKLWQPFVDANKPVFAIEYSAGCGTLASLKQNGLLKSESLDSPAYDCTKKEEIFS